MNKVIEFYRPVFSKQQPVVETQPEEPSDEELTNPVVQVKKLAAMAQAGEIESMIVLIRKPGERRDKHMILTNMLEPSEINFLLDRFKFQFMSAFDDGVADEPTPEPPRFA
jgi:hypothetical protein